MKRRRPYKRFSENAAVALLCAHLMHLAVLHLGKGDAPCVFVHFKPNAARLTVEVYPMGWSTYAEPSIKQTVKLLDLGAEKELETLYAATLTAIRKAVTTSLITDQPGIK